MSNNRTLNQKFELYIKLNKDISEFRKKQKEQKKILQALEEDIQQHMVDNNLTKIPLNDGDIVLYEKKTNQTFKKSTMTNKLSEILKVDESKAEKIAESIVSNKIFTTESKLKANIKK